MILPQVSFFISSIRFRSYIFSKVQRCKAHAFHLFKVFYYMMAPRRSNRVRGYKKTHESCNDDQWFQSNTSQVQPSSHSSKGVKDQTFLNLLLIHLKEMKSQMSWNKSLLTRHPKGRKSTSIVMESMHIFKL